MNENEINDVRNSSDFKNITFSEFSRSKVKIELIKSIHNNNIEPACYWSAELICSGLYQDIWEIIILYTSRYIYVSNPRLPLYIELRLESFREIINNGFSENILKLRNNEKITVDKNIYWILNCGNFIVSKNKYLEVMQSYYRNDSIPLAADALAISYLWLKAGKTIQLSKELYHFHRKRKDSVSLALVDESKLSFDFFKEKFKF